MKNKYIRQRHKGKTIALVIIGLISAWLLGVFIWYRVNLRPVSTSTVQTPVTVSSGESMGEIADMLVSKKLIRSATAFKAYVTIHGLRAGLQTGTYELRPNLTSQAIAIVLVGGKTADQQMTIPEGFTIAQIRARAAKFGISNKDFDAALSENYPGTQAANRPAGTSLEGYLFPDTYTVTPLTSANDLVRTMLQHFDTKVNSDIIAGFQAQGLTLQQGLTLASIVEREVPGATDRAHVAGVFYNRLRKGQKLQSDVTVHYAADLAGKSFNLSINSPYNTYVIPGLPIGPICNPGLSSMQAVAQPASTSDFYFVAGTDGVTHYAVTQAQHEANVKKYLRN